MPGEIEPRLPDYNLAREQFLADLSGFIIEAGKNGWAAEAPRVEVPQRPCFKELSYNRGQWEYRDSYAGYFMAPGSSVVYYQGVPVWYMTYGGVTADNGGSYLERHYLGEGYVIEDRIQFAKDALETIAVIKAAQPQAALQQPA